MKGIDLSAMSKTAPLTRNNTWTFTQTHIHTYIHVYVYTTQHTSKAYIMTDGWLDKCIKIYLYGTREGDG